MISYIGIITLIMCFCALRLAFGMNHCVFFFKSNIFIFSRIGMIDSQCQNYMTGKLSFQRVFTRIFLITEEFFIIFSKFSRFFVIFYKFWKDSVM